ncbi:serine/threonine-protein phosphatase 6 regulatory ankyrin repeat subunit C-like [Mercenaria mercenaria]|uniref:serine/threonine-protein phosphatase 6 regulatory ankyrin repeat subunit C-like n=1 Tax=Mercenaria mercenaria TaxID=6596 RepID=UPI00234F897A|nr:serine/threonine-protein phosphatase 6 regulatory ankyrin repeat subunit C-like [Mercenaria mercenaria]
MDNENVNISDNIRMITAVQENNARLVKQLIERGQNQFTLDSSLCWATRLGYLPLVILLVEGGADPNSEVWGGFSPLIWVTIFSGDTDVVRYLVNSGADVDHCSSKRKQTALHAAVIKGDARLVQCLIDTGASLDVQDYLYKTPLLHATQRNLKNVVKTLILNNCNVNLPGFVNGTRLSPLLVALLQSNLEITKMLILAGAKFELLAIYQTFTLSHFYKTVEDCLNLEVRPVYLQQQCRVSIRELLKPQFLQKLRQLELPPPLREFLSMEELNRAF